MFVELNGTDCKPPNQNSFSYNCSIVIVNGVSMDMLMVIVRKITDCQGFDKLSLA